MHRDQILIVEDDPLIAQDLQDRLETLDYTVTATTDRAEQALGMTQRLRPDLVLMDLQLSGNMDGIQAAAQIRTQQVPVVFVTGFGEGPLFERAKLSEPCGYILKSYETRDLKIAIELALHQHHAKIERQHLADQLQNTLASLKPLSGRLSICAYCKKIKDEAGDWTQLEIYLMAHSAASFTHGMCPGCFDQVKNQLAAFDQHDLPPGSLILG